MLMVKKNNHSKPFLEEINPRLELLSAHCYSNNKPIYFKNNSRGTGATRTFRWWNGGTRSASLLYFSRATGWRSQSLPQTHEREGELTTYSRKSDPTCSGSDQPNSLKLSVNFDSKKN